MKAIREFEIPNEKYDPRKKLKIFLTKDIKGFYFWACVEYKWVAFRKRTGGSVILKLKDQRPMSTLEGDNRYSTIAEAMKFKKYMETSGVWNFIPL